MQKVSIVTGGMHGIGLAAIKFLLAKGWIVIATTANGPLFRKTTSLRHKNLNVIPLAGNDTIHLKPFIANILAKHEKIDLLINHEDFESAKTSAVEDYAAAAIAMSNHVLPCMKDECFGHIIFISFSEYQAGESSILIKEFIMQNQDCTRDMNIKLTIIDPAQSQFL